MEVSGEAARIACWLLRNLWFPLFGEWWRQNAMPNVWRQGETVPIPQEKCGKSSCPCDLRGITLISTLSKALCSC